MALNMSHKQFVSCLPEENIVSSTRIANGCYEYEDKMGNCNSDDLLHKDILDLLPANPFGMDMSSTFTAITSWLEDLKVDFHEDDSKNNVILTGFDFAWDTDTNFHAFYDEYGSETDLFGLDYLCFENDINRFSCHHSSEIDCHFRDLVEDINASSLDGEVSAPHSAFNFVLSHLGLRDLLMMESVCKSFLHIIRNDTLLWRNICIDQPLNEKITDEILMKLASRSQGRLHCLSLTECTWITDGALKHVLEQNPRISKLSVPGCTRLSIDSVISSLMTLKCSGAGVKHLRVGGLFGVTINHFEKMKSLLDFETETYFGDHKPHFYEKGNQYFSFDDERAIDIQCCPKCQNLRMVYDCPSDSCEDQSHCRGCTLCIPRCSRCGICVCDGEYEETFCLELVCSKCWNS